ncbi:MAG: hypothetical protein MMC33_008151 [Icmadophila ericetorum]|nr:hypothetical protein [Icmadophila ericetorum]
MSTKSSPEPPPLTNASNSPSLSPPRKRKREDVTLEEIEVNIEAPEPPSKKAVRKAKKHKIKPSAKTADAQTEALSTEPQGTLNGASAKKSQGEDTSTDARSEHGIWIGNLPWSATPARLREFFVENSNVVDEAITRVHMPVPTDVKMSGMKGPMKPQNKGFAYVDFSTKQAQMDAIALSETLFTGRRVLIKPSTSFEGRPDKSESNGTPKAPLEKPPSNRIFVGNLAFDTTREELREHFKQCGEVADVFITTFEDSGKCKGYGWVTFEDVEAAEAAVKGFVFLEPEANAEEEEPDEKPKKKEPKKRKWWVNQIKGRKLRMEFAEGKDVRYRKRYGKDAKRPAEEADGPADAIVEVEDAKLTPRVEAKRSMFDRKKVPARESTTWSGKKQDAPGVTMRDAVAKEQYLTGAAVKGQGKKITFD